MLGIWCENGWMSVFYIPNWVAGKKSWTDTVLYILVINPVFPVVKRLFSTTSLLDYDDVSCVYFSSQGLHALGCEDHGLSLTLNSSHHCPTILSSIYTSCTSLSFIGCLHTSSPPRVQQLTIFDPRIYFSLSMATVRAEMVKKTFKFAAPFLLSKLQKDLRLYQLVWLCESKMMLNITDCRCPAWCTYYVGWFGETLVIFLCYSGYLNVFKMFVATLYQNLCKVCCCLSWLLRIVPLSYFLVTIKANKKWFINWYENMHCEVGRAYG